MNKLGLSTEAIVLFIGSLILMVMLMYSPFVFGASSIPAKIKRPGDIWVMVIDTGVGKHDKLRNIVQYDETSDYVDKSGHGTHVAGIIAFGNNKLDSKLCRQVKIFSCKYTDLEGGYIDHIKNTVNCINKATKLGVDYINYSSGGFNVVTTELAAIKRFINSGGVIVAAAGNNRMRLTDTKGFFPASYAFDFRHKSEVIKGTNSVVMVQAECVPGSLCSFSNWHPDAKRELGKNIYSTLPNNRFGLSSGTSQAAPAYLHKVLKQRCEQIIGR